MGKVQVNGLVEGEGERVVVESDVDLSFWVVNDMVIQASEDLLHIANTNSATCG